MMTPPTMATRLSAADRRRLNLSMVWNTIAALLAIIGAAIAGGSAVAASRAYQADTDCRRAEARVSTRENAVRDYAGDLADLALLVDLAEDSGAPPFVMDRLAERRAAIDADHDAYLRDFPPLDPEDYC